MNMTAILKRMKDERMTRYLKDVQQARAEFGDLLKDGKGEDIFAYRKGSQWLMVSKPSDISKRWRDHKGLPPVDESDEED